MAIAAREYLRWTGQNEREELVSRAFVTLADTLVDDYDVIDLLDRLVGFSVELLRRRRRRHRARRRPAASCGPSPHPARTRTLMELLQLQSDEGPCLDCFRSGARSASPI